MGQSFRVQHTEYLQDVISGDGTTVVYNLNAGHVDSFPWLGQFGPIFEQYRFNKLKFKYMPACSTQTPGTITMATVVDAQAPPLLSLDAMLAYRNSMSTGLWKAAMQDALVEPCPILFCRPSTQPAGTDIKTYDYGNFEFRVDGAPAPPETVLGRLMVSYDVEFFVPMMSNGAFDATVAYARNTPTPILSAGSPFNGVGLAQRVIQFGLNELKVNSNTTAFFSQPGLYQTIYNAYGVLTSGTGWVPSGAGGSMWTSDPRFIVYEQSNAQGSGNTMATCVIEVLVAGLVLTTAFAGTATYAGMKFSINALNPGLVAGGALLLRAPSQHISEKFGRILAMRYRSEDCQEKIRALMAVDEPSSEHPRSERKGAYMD